MGALLLIWWAGFLASIFAVSDVETGLVGAARATGSGSAMNQVLILAFGAIGLANVPHALRALRLRSFQTFLLLLLTYIVWAIASALWSDDPLLSVRRLVGFLAIVVGGIGIGAGFYGRRTDGLSRLGKHVVWAAFVSTVLLIVLRVWDSGVAILLQPEWNLKDTSRASYFGQLAGFAMVAALLILKVSAAKRFTAVVGCLVSLIFLKGRSILASSAAIACLFASPIINSRLLRPAVLCTGLLLAGAVTDLGTGGHLTRALFEKNRGLVAEWIPYLTINAGEDNITELTGRIPLWKAALTDAAKHPFIGYGFGAYWTATRLDGIYPRVGWWAVTAHNGFLDEVLATGVVGLSLFLAVWLFAIGSSLRNWLLAKHRPSLLVAGWLSLFLLFNAMESILQFSFQLPMLLCLTAVGAFWGQLACLPKTRPMRLAGPGRGYVTAISQQRLNEYARF
jgi:exopolysaccharide production protein ExoQ